LTCGTPAAEARAAVSLLEFALRGVELTDLAAAVEAMKAEMEELKRGTPGAPARGGEGPLRDSPPAGQGPAAAGPTAGGPLTDSERNGDDPGPLANQSPKISFSEDVTPLF